MIKILLSDSMEQIQAKLLKGGDIVFEKGAYKITKQLIVVKRSTIDLGGSTLQRYGNLQSVFINKCKPTDCGYLADGNIKILNGTIEGIGKFSKDNLITLFHSHDVIFENLIIKDILCHGIELNSTRDCLIKGCKFLGTNVDYPYKENLQLDFAYAGGFYLQGSKLTDKCYDGTGCLNVEIVDCLFDKSDSRGYCSVAIGEHVNLANNNTHKNIKIHNNVFKSLAPQDDTLQAINICSMNGVEIYENEFTGFGRLARIYSQSYVYNLKGEKIAAKATNGISENITIENNKYSDQVGKCCGLVSSVSKSGCYHKNIVVKNNKSKNVVTKMYAFLEYIDGCNFDGNDLGILKKRCL